jgi:hypothetical protein
MTKIDNINQALNKLDDEKTSQKVEQLASKRAEEIAASKIEELKDSLAQSITGKKEPYEWEKQGKKEPENYEELFTEVDKRVNKIAKKIEKQVDRKLTEREKKKIQQQEKKREQELKSAEQLRRQWDSQWYDLVNQGKLPKVQDEIQEKINKGEKLSQQEMQSDPGLQARAKLYNTAKTMGKSPKLAYYEDYNNSKARSAPVLGSSPANVSASDDDYTHEDEKATRKMLGI